MMNGEARMKGDDLRERTTRFALRVIRLCASLPKTTEAQVIGRQLLRSGTSVGAHYREACRARSRAEFVSKTEGAIAELDETCYWFELLVRGEIVAASKLTDLQREAEELLAILVSSVKTAKAAEDK
jgi:four helix bundle protein